MMKIALFIFFLLACVHADLCIAQTSSPNKAVSVNHRPPWYKRSLITIDSIADRTRFNSVFIEPVALIDVANGFSLRLGAERWIFRHWSVTGTAGIYLNGTKFPLQKGWIIKGELKKYLRPRNKHHNLQYLSAEYCYRQTDYTRDDSIRMPVVPYYIKTYNISKFVTSFRIKYGVVLALSNKLTLEYYWGAGIRYKFASATLTEDELKYIYYNYDNYSRTISSEIGRFIRPDLSLGIRLGFRY